MNSMKEGGGHGESLAPLSTRGGSVALLSRSSKKRRFKWLGGYGNMSVRLPAKVQDVVRLGGVAELEESSGLGHTGGSLTTSTRTEIVNVPEYLQVHMSLQGLPSGCTLLQTP